MFKKYMCLALCLLMALGTMSTTASAASSADALVASYVSFSDSTGAISDLPESESTITASVTVSNNSSKASSVVLWVGKFVDDVLTDVTYVEHPLAGNEQGAVVTASLDGIKKDLATAADGTAYDRTVVKAFVWSAMVGGKALAPVASLPSDNVDVLAVKKDGEIWKDFDPAVTEYELTLQATDPYPEFEFVLADNSTRVEMPDAFAFGKNTVKVISAAGTEKDYTINLIDGTLSEGSLLFDDFESYGGTLDDHIWNVYLDNSRLVEELNGNTYLSMFGTSGQLWPRIDKTITGIDYKNPLEISGRGMLQGAGDAVPSFTLEIRRSASVKETALEVSKSTIKVFGQVIGGGVEPGTWFSYKLILEKPVDSSIVTASVVITGDGLKDTSGQKVTSLSGSGSKDLANLELNNDIPLMFNCGGLDAEGKVSVNLDDIKVAYPIVLSNDTTLGSLKYAVDGVTRDVTDFVPGVAADYRIYVPEGTTSVTLKPVPNIARAAKAEVYVGGVLSADGAVAIAGDETEAVIKVTAEDGTTTAEHKVTIIIGEEGVSTNTNLASLTYAIGDGEPTTVPGFEPSDATDEDRAYNVLLPLGTASVTLGVTPINEKATYQIFYADGDEIADGVVDLAKGTSVKIVVTPEDAGAAKGTYTIDFAIDKGMYVLDESNGAVQSDKSGIEFKTAVLESGSATYEYANGFTMNGVGASANRNSEYVLNGEGKNLGYTWTLSSEDYAPGTYSVYVKGTSYGSGSKDSFYFVYDEAVCSPDGGLMFLSPAPKDEPVAGHNMVALNWVKGDKTITIPENGSAKLRILGRENGAFVDKVMLINSAVTKTIEEAEVEMCPAYDAVFTSESGETLATVKYGSDVVGTAVPTEGTYLNGESIPETGTINALVVPEKEGFTGSWNPETLQENGTTFVPSYSSGEENQVLELTESVPPSEEKYAMKAETIVFGTTSPYLLYSLGEEWNEDGANPGASLYGAQKAPAFFEGATAIRRDKNDSKGSNNTDAPMAKWWGDSAYSGKDGNGYYVTFKVSSDATVYVVDREGKGWPNKPVGWETSSYKYDNKVTMFYKTFKAGELVQLPNYGWDTSWTDKTSGDDDPKAIKDPSQYVVVWGECPEPTDPEPSDTTIFSDDFEAYTVDTPINNSVKGWDAINDNKASFISVANPAGGQMAQVKALTKLEGDVDKGQKYPSMHKNANQLKETLDATGMEAIAISGKVQIHNTADTKPSHYIELRNTANNDTSKRLTTLSITTDNIKFFDTKEAPNVIGSATPDTWIDYTLYIKPGALDAETQFTVVLTGEGLKDADGTPTDRIVATKSQVYNVMAEDNGLRVVYNHAIPKDDGSYVYLDDLKIFAANVPEIEPEPQPTEEIFSDDFEAYGLNASIDKDTKGWGNVISADNFTAVANPVGEGQVGEVKAAAERYPSLRKDVSMQGGETYLFSGKARLHDSEETKPQHYLEFRPSGTEIKQVLLRIATQGITLAGDDNNIIGYASPDAWVSYKLYVTPGQAQTTFVAELTGEGLKDANNQPTDKILAGGKMDLTDFVPASGEKNILVILNHRFDRVDDARIYLDDIVISKGAAAPALSANTNLASLKYTPNGGAQTDVPGFAADKAAYDVELPKGTTSVTIAAATEDTNARTIVMVGEDAKKDKVVPVSADTATEAIVRVLAQDGTTKDITLTFTVSDEEPVEPTEVISDLTYATNDVPTLAQIELGVTESYTNAGGCQVGAASSQEFAGAYVLQRNKSGDTSAPNNEEPYFVGKFDGQGGNPYWMTFTMNVPGTVYVVDMEGKGWPNKGDWAVDTSGLSFKIWDSYYNGNTGKLYSKHYSAGETVQVPNYGWDNSWADGSKEDGRYFTNPSIYLIVPDSNLEKNASLKSLTYTVGEGEAETVGEFISGIVPAEALKVGVESATGVKIAAEPITNSGATVTFGGAASADGTVTFTGTTAEVTITVTSKDTTKTNTYTINFTADASEPEPGEVLFEDNFEGYGDATVPDATKWDQVYESNVKLVADGENKYLSIFPTTERFPRVMKKYMAVDPTQTIHFSGKVMVTDGAAANSPNIQIEVRDGSGNKDLAARLLQMKTSGIKVLDGPSIGTMTSGQWVNYDIYLTVGNETDAKVVAVLTGEGLKDAGGQTVTTLRGENTKDISSLKIAENQNMAILINASFNVAEATDTFVCADDYKVAYGEAPVVPDTNLKSLTYNGVSVPNFAATTTSYTITMPTADAVAIAAEANAAGADVNIDKASLTPSAEGDVANITVTSNGETKKYTVTAKLDATANKVLNLSSASKADVQDNLVLGTGNNDGSLAYNDRTDVYYTNATSKFFEGATYIRPAKNDGAGVYSTLPYFSDKYNGKDGNPYWLEFVVSSDCRIFFADSYYNVDKTSKDPAVAEQAKPWPNMPEGWTVAGPTDDVDIMGTKFWAATENGSVYYKDFDAGDVVQIPNYGAPSYWADDRQPYDPPVYLIVWGSDVQNPGIDDGGEPGGEGGGAEDGGETR